MKGRMQIYTVRVAGRFLTCKTRHLSVYHCGGKYSERQVDVEG